MQKIVQNIWDFFIIIIIIIIIYHLTLLCGAHIRAAGSF